MAKSSRSGLRRRVISKWGTLPSLLVFTLLVMVAYSGFSAAYIQVEKLRRKSGQELMNSINDYINNDLLPLFQAPELAVEEDREGAVYYTKENKKARRPAKSDIFELLKLTDGMTRSVCRIPSACRLADGTLLLPDFMKKHERTMHQKCGITQFYKYYSFNSSTKTNTGYEGFDLIGVGVPRDHMPHFTTDFFPQFTAIDVIMGERDARSVIYTCLLPDGRRCARARPTTSGINPALFVDEKVKRTGPEGWVRSFLGAMPRKPGPGPRLLFPSDYDSVENQNAATVGDLGNEPSGLCFKSIIYNPHSLIPQDISLNHIMFRLNNIQKEQRKECSKLITIVNRPGTQKRSGFPIGRDIVDVEELPELIRAAAAEQELTDVRVEIVYFDKTSYEDQVAAMQATDLLIAPHGAALTNTIFMKANTTAIEIMPFAYVANIYQIITRSFSVRYEQFTAEPDDQQMVDCLAYFNPRGSPGETAGQSFAERYSRVAENWRGRDEVGKLRYEQEMEYHMNKFLEVDVKNQRPCLRAQRLRLDLKKLAERAVTVVKNQCNNVVELDDFELSEDFFYDMLEE